MLSITVLTAAVLPRDCFIFSNFSKAGRVRESIGTICIFGRFPALQGREETGVGGKEKRQSKKKKKKLERKKKIQPSVQDLLIALYLTDVSVSMPRKAV